MSAPRLTQFATAAGCAAKLRMSDLQRVIKEDPASRPARHDAVLVGYELSDDAAVVKLPGDDTRGLVMTTDFISPLVDDAFTFGAIAATNALSDVYAMGGLPLYALNIVAFPEGELPLDVLSQIMNGAAHACSSVGVPIVGGHTVRNPDLKFGLAVTGEVQLDQVLSNDLAQAGQALVLSKALGVGIIGTAIKRGLATSSQAEAAIASMCRMNDVALRVARRHGVTSATDVTGFGLCLHLSNILFGSRLRARIDLAALPLLPGALELAAQGVVPGGSRANLETVQPRLRGVTDAPDHLLRTVLACDAQTSGGLLLCVPKANAQAALLDLRETGHTAAVVGELLPPTPEAPVGTIELM
ncbi:MAG TPA: selenide, water dikinase SelD [Polyangiaceae bacterium]|nr:selenide, water dikinase SelD [Polyangiaceae bacterium]